MTEARELLQGMREAEAELQTLKMRRRSLIESIARAKSIPTRDPGMNVQTSRSTNDYMGEVIAEVEFIETDMKRLGQILTADRQRVRKIIPHLGRDEREIVRLYFVCPVKNSRGDLRTWQDVEDLMHLSHTATMKRRKRMFKEVNRIIEEHGL